MRLHIGAVALSAWHVTRADVEFASVLVVLSQKVSQSGPYGVVGWPPLWSESRDSSVAVKANCWRLWVTYTLIIRRTAVPLCYTDSCLQPSMSVKTRELQSQGNTVVVGEMSALSGKCRCAQENTSMIRETSAWSGKYQRPLKYQKEEDLSLGGGGDTLKPQHQHL